MDPCARCGSNDAEVYWSVAANQWLCQRCYRRLDSAQYQPTPGPKPEKLKTPAAPKPTPYQAFVSGVWDGIERETGHTPFYLDAHSIASFCPVCLFGTVRWTFIDARDEPQLVVTSSDRPGRCSLGCTALQIAAAIA